MNVSRSELHALRSERRAYAQCVAGIREATGLRDVPLADLPAMVEQLLSELADRQIRRDIEAQAPAAEPPYDDWSPEDTVAPVPVSDCRTCLRLVEIDGRLTCSEPRSLPWHYATITWPGPGCVWASDADKIYGR